MELHAPKIKGTIYEVTQTLNDYDLVLFDELLNAQTIGFFSEEGIINLMINLYIKKYTYINYI